LEQTNSAAINPLKPKISSLNLTSQKLPSASPKPSIQALKNLFSTKLGDEEIDKKKKIII